MHKNHRRKDPRHSRKQYKFRYYAPQARTMRFLKKSRSKARRNEERYCIKTRQYSRLMNRYPKDIAWEF